MSDEAACTWVDLSQGHGVFAPGFTEERARRSSLEGDELTREVAARLKHASEARQPAVELIGFAITEIPRELSALDWLEALHLGATAVRDLAPLTALRNLTDLNLCGTGVSDLRPLVQLKHLKRLDLGNTGVIDLGPLAELKRLTTLDLGDTLVSDLGPLVELRQLTRLTVGHPPIDDLDPLALWKWSALAKRHSQSLGSVRVPGRLANGTPAGGGVGGASVSDLRPLAELTQLTELGIRGTSVSSLVPLAELKQLATLDLGETRVSDLGPLAGLRQLTALDLSRTGVSDLGPLAGLKQLATLDLGNTSVSDLGPLAELKQLATLDLSETRVNDLGPLAELNQLTRLDLSRTGVSDLGPLAELKQLTTLDLSETRVGDLGPIANLTRLTVLDLSQSRVSDLGPLGGLRQLVELRLSSTNVSQLEPLTELTSLTQLGLSNTDVSDLVPLSGLTELTVVLLDHTKVSELLPLRGLTNLTQLALSSTRVSDLVPLEGLKHLTGLDLQGAPVSGRMLARIVSSLPELWALSASPCAGLPAELFGHDCARRLRDYFAALESGAAPNRELKVVLVGNGSVGKTTLADRLMGREPGNYGPCERTHGIVTQMFALELGAGETLGVRLWDFGGQAIYHATHRCFLHRGSLYLLLWSEEDELALPEHAELPAEPDAREPVRYWLHWLQQLASESPILLVKNKIDSRDQRTLPPSLSGAEKPFTDQCSISAKTNEGVEERLRPALALQAEKLRHQWGYALPRSWLAVRQELERLRCDAVVPVKSIDLGHFERVCQQCGVVGVSTLLDYLHDTGFLYHRSGVFSDLVVLDQNWFIEAVYRLLDPRQALDERGRQRPSPRHRILQQRGQFSGVDARDFWPEHDDADCETFLAFMRQTAIVFEVSWNASNQRKPFEERRFVVPGLLPPGSDRAVQAALVGWPPAAACVVELEYAFLPRSLLQQLMVRLYTHASAFEAWATGFLYTLAQNGDQVRVELCARPDGSGDLRIEACSLRRTIPRGSIEAVRGLLAEVRELEGPPWQSVWVAPDARQQGGRVELSALHKALQKRPDGGYVPTRDEDAVPAVDYRVFLELLEEPREDEHAPAVASEQTAPRPIRVFISYAHEDGTHLARLETTLKGLQRRHPELTWWHDRKLVPGTRWEQAPEGRAERNGEQGIVDQLNQADITCLLVSPDFMASDYCWCKELPVALGRYHSNGGYAVPIVIRHTPEWPMSQLGAIQALPEGARPLSTWGDPDEFWASVSEGLARTLQLVREARLRLRSDIR